MSDEKRDLYEPDEPTLDEHELPHDYFMPASSLDSSWAPFDPAWLVTLAELQLPDDPRVVAALSACRIGRWESQAYLHFVDASSPNQPGSEWQFDRNAHLNSPEYGPLVLDVLKDGRIGGVEFLRQIDR